MFISLINKYGKVKVCLMFSFVISMLSMIFASIFLSIFQGYIDFIGIFLSFSMPMTITPIILLKFSSLLLTIEGTKNKLEKKNIELENALSEIKTLSGLLPICVSCKKIRDDKGYWNQIESYISSHTDAKFSHGICGQCTEKLYGDQEWYKKKFELD